MDVDRIQKINALALDLMRQGLAVDRQDAMVQAEKIYRDKDFGEIDFFKRAEKAAASVNSGSPSSEENLTQDSVRNILEQNTKFIVQKFKEFGDRMESMQRDMDQLKSHVSSIRIPSVTELVEQNKQSQSMQSMSSRPQPQPQIQAQSMPRRMPSTSPVANHPRSGNYNENDVSIEKFFYMGSK
jgi:hypothetical protein